MAGIRLRYSVILTDANVHRLTSAALRLRGQTEARAALAGLRGVMRYAVCMKRTTIMLPDEVDARLRHEARRRGTSIAEVAREAIEKELPSQGDGRLSFFAIGEGSPSDASERVDELVAESVHRRRADRAR